MRRNGWRKCKLRRPSSRTLEQGAMWFQPTKLFLMGHARAVTTRKGSGRFCVKAVWVLFLALALATSGLCRPDQAALERRARQPAKDILGYDGRWWVSEDHNERSGFLTGTGSCLNTDGRQQIFWGDYASIDDAIRNYYERHPTDRRLSVMEVWGKVGSSVHERKALEGGERYRYPGGPDGDWYKQAPYSERLGFLEGYLAS